jgi:VWFA-related protein
VRHPNLLRIVPLMLFPLLIAPFIHSQIPQQAPPLRVTTRLVQVSVLVHDEHGEPLTGLTKDDFELLDQGRPQAITQFSVDSIQPAPSAPPTPPSPNVFSNRTDQPSGIAGTTTVILIDSSNTHVQDLTFATHKLEAFLAQMQPQDRVALYSLSDGLLLVRDFTNDGQSLLKALAGLQHAESLNMSGSADGNIETRIYFQTRRAEDTPTAFRSLANHMAGIPGRKNLIWISGAFPESTGYLRMGNRRSFETEIDRAARYLTDANVAVYPIDARGLMTRDNSQLADWRNFSTMDLFADLTGGKASYNNNDIGGAIRRAIDDSRVTYALGYYPDQNKWDGTFHEIKVKVHRHGAQVRYRQGYFAGEQSVMADQKHRAQLILDAAADPLEATAVGLKLETISVDPAAAADHRRGYLPNLKMRLTIDPRDILLNPNAGRWTGSVDLYYAETDKKQIVLTSLFRTLDLSLPSTDYERIEKDGVKVICDFPIKPGASVIHLVAMDSSTGAVGTVKIPLANLISTSSEK